MTWNTLRKSVESNPENVPGHHNWTKKEKLLKFTCVGKRSAFFTFLAGTLPRPGEKGKLLYISKQPSHYISGNIILIFHFPIPSLRTEVAINEASMVLLSYRDCLKIAVFRKKIKRTGVSAMFTEVSTRGINIH